MNTNSSNRVIIEKASKHAKIYSMTGRLIMNIGFSVGIIVFAIVFAMPSKFSEKSASMLMIGGLVLSSVIYVIGWCIEKYAKYYQWYDRGGLDDEI